MGMDLIRAGGYFRWTNKGWSWVLELAEEFGWVPLGASAPRGARKADWDKRYWSNAGNCCTLETLPR